MELQRNASGSIDNSGHFVVDDAPLHPQRTDQPLQLLVQGMDLVGVQRAPALELGVQRQVRRIAGATPVDADLNCPQARDAGAHGGDRFEKQVLVVDVAQPAFEIAQPPHDQMFHHRPCSWSYDTGRR